ncbi:MAG: hypothetical protein HPY45_13255 [Anaerolineae bacterium]|nr:hypothetical protein [Anaerolineae bacterium]
MSYQEKRTVVSIASSALLLAAYCVYAFTRYGAGAAATADLKVWAGTMLIFIGVGIAVSIVIQIVFHILLSISIAVKRKIQDQTLDDKEIEKSIGSEMVEDEMDRLIDLKSTRVGFFFAGVGFVAGLVALVLGFSAVVMLNIIFLSFGAASMLEGFIQLYYYRRGV